MKNFYENTILIVDDTPGNIDILVELLEDFDTKIAINGEDALETAFEGDPPDLILLDIMMPEMDGYEVCEKLRANEKTKNIPVIFLTAKTEKDDIVKGFEVGGQDYITKPFDARELMERVKTQLELKSQREILKNMNIILEEKVQERTAQLQEALSNLDKANKELQGLDTAKNSFLMMISHELRTPLNGIVGASYFLRDSLSEDKELGEFVDMLKLSVDRLEKFSTTALIITQLQAEYKLSIETIDMVELAKQCIEKYKEAAKEKVISIFKDIVDPDLKIDAEKVMIERAVNSIIDNAIKYSEENSFIRLKIYADGNKKIIEVSDKGRGFTQEALDKLFKPFGLGEQHYDDNIGLSLKATKHIMEAHGGEIEVENLEEGGACVRLIFLDEPTA
jgi:two-component system, sensor histidine kinase and response regulator